MSTLASEVLRRIAVVPLSAMELAEDFGFSEFERDELAKIRRALQDLQNTGQVKRVDDPRRDEGPFYAVPFPDAAPSVETLADDPAGRSYLRLYENPAE